MKVLISYVAVTNGPETFDFCSRFVGSWVINPPGIECEIMVACNGGPPSKDIALLFSPLSVSFLPRKNDDGWDISAHQEVARKMPCDCLVCFGQSVYFWKEGWLKPIVEAWKKYGPGFYGFMSSFMVRPHMNTTAFACDPKFLMGWPQVDNHPARYNFEHGKHSFWKHMADFRKPTKLVTWDGTYDPPQWRYPKNILWRGDQSNLLVFCNHVDRYFAASEETKKKWAYAADNPK